jgi:dTDP-4-dehydrorhamnose 3,5-epimerase-like enzyme
MGIERCRTIELPVAADPLGNLAFAEGENHVPFPIARVFFVYDLPAGAARGGHAHRALEEVVFCISGRLELFVDDGQRQRAFTLEDPRQGLYLPPLIWYDLRCVAPDTTYLGLTSKAYDEDDYIRDRDAFLAAVRTPVLDS